jgi:hypothetical protein
MEWRDRNRMPERAADGTRAEMVNVPKAHEGVGRALRNAFAAGVPELPRDMSALLERLR